jgi:tetratricopeptide (TPR) repeat protein
MVPVDRLDQHRPEALPARALLGWMEAPEAIRFLTKDCIFTETITEDSAKSLWEFHKRALDRQSGATGEMLTPLPMTDADLKTIRKFRSRYPDERTIVDFVKLNPRDLIIHQHWISPEIADKYSHNVTPDKWAQLALLDPPSHAPASMHREGNTILFDLPHEEFFLSCPRGPLGTLQVSEPRGFVTVALHANRALLVSGYHRVFALAEYCRTAANAPRGVLFGVSNALELLGNDAADVRAVMERARPPRLGDFFEPELCTEVLLRRRRYQLRIQYEIVQIEDTETQPEHAETANIAESDGRNGHQAVGETTQALSLVPTRRSDAVARKRAERIFENAARLYREGRREDAITEWETGLRFMPENALAHLNVAQALLEQGGPESAAAHASQAVYLDPGSAGAHMNLGASLERLGRTEEAGLHFRQALSIEPENDAALCNLGHTLSVEGDISLSVDCLRKVIKHNPTWSRAYIHLAIIHHFQSGDDEFAGMEKLARKSDLPDPDAINVHFAFGKALEDIGEYNRAFGEFQKGNSLKRRKIEYDEAQAQALFQRISNSFDQELMQKLRGAGNYSHVPVFIVGMPRSGTTLVEQILASHPEVHGAGELDHVSQIARAVLSGNALPAKFSELGTLLSPDVLETQAQEYLRKLPPSASGMERVVDKMPGNFVHAGLIRLMFPNARIIHTVRNPLDTCVSCYCTLFEKGQFFSYELGELGRYYRGYFELMAHWRRVMPVDSILDVSYEALVADPEGQSRRLIEHCGLAWDDRCLEFHTTKRPVRTASLGQVRRPLYATSVGRWRRFDGLLKPLESTLNSLAELRTFHAGS